jgi:RNA polymerase sigma-70 factor (ECF subfamily)
MDAAALFIPTSSVGRQKFVEPFAFPGAIINGAGILMTSNGPLSDSELLKLMLAGNEEALSILYERRQRNIYRFAMQMTGSPQISEDVTQDVFIVLIRNGAMFDERRGTLNSFLLGVARNLVRQRISRERLFVSLNSEIDDPGVCDENQSSFDLAEELARDELIESVRKAVLTLPTRYREVVVLCDLQGMSYVEVAKVLSCAVGTVRSRLHRARAMLLKKFRPENEERKARATITSARCVA